MRRWPTAHCFHASRRKPRRWPRRAPIMPARSPRPKRIGSPPAQDSRPRPTSRVTTSAGFAILRGVVGPAARQTETTTKVGGRAMLRTMSLLAAILCASATMAEAETYPDRPVRVVVGFAAGSGPDIHARTVSQELGNSLGQQFYVENRLGANGTIPAGAGAH